MNGLYTISTLIFTIKIIYAGLSTCSFGRFIVCSPLLNLSARINLQFAINWLKYISRTAGKPTSMACKTNTASPKIELKCKTNKFTYNLCKLTSMYKFVIQEFINSTIPLSSITCRCMGMI